MRIAGLEILDKFCKKHADTRKPIAALLAKIQSAEWKKFSDIKSTFNSADQVGDIVILNLKGNNYRVEIRIIYINGIVKVIWIGTHGGYDKRNKGR